MVTAIKDLPCIFYINIEYDKDIPITTDRLKIMYYSTNSEEWLELTGVEYKSIGPYKIRCATIFIDIGKLPIKIMYKDTETEEYIEIGNDLINVETDYVKSLETALYNIQNTLDNLFGKALDDVTLRRELNKLKDNMVFETKKLLRNK